MDCKCHYNNRRELIDYAKRWELMETWWARLTRYSFLSAIIAALYFNAHIAILPNLGQVSGPSVYVAIAQLTFLMGVVILVVTEINSFLSSIGSEKKLEKKLEKRYAKLEQEFAELKEKVKKLESGK